MKFYLMNMLFLRIFQVKKNFSALNKQNNPFYHLILQKNLLYEKNIFLLKKKINQFKNSSIKKNQSRVPKKILKLNYRNKDQLKDVGDVLFSFDI